MTRAELVVQAGESIRIGSKSFYMASRLFDRTTRERAWLLYCWCRHCDDQCDGQRHGGRTRDEAGSVATLETLTRKALAGEETSEVPFEALRQVLAECAIPPRYVFDHLGGFALDERGWRPATERDLIQYCYHVAGAVGCMMAVAMGVPPEDEETLQRACDLGISFQLANIARDVREDHEAGRCYLPLSLMEKEGLDPSDPLRADQRSELVAVVRRLTDLAGSYERAAQSGVSKLPFRARWAVLASGRIYGAIGRRVATRGAAAWDQRVFVRRREKLAFLLPSLVEAARVGRAG